MMYSIYTTSDHNYAMGTNQISEEQDNFKDDYVDNRPSCSKDLLEKDIQIKKELPKDPSSNIINIDDPGYDASVSIESSDCDTVGTETNEPVTENIVCEYPFGEPGRITITKIDVETLNPGTFLNDNIIDFYMKYMNRELLENSEQPKVHILPTYFYKRLVKDPVPGSYMYRQEMLSNMSMAKKRFARVERWLRKIKLLEKSLVLIPVCESAHWYLIVLVNPGGNNPCLLVLNSMVRCNTTAVFIIKEFLITLRSTLSLTYPDNVHVLRPSTPQQRNGFDCGIYLLHYASKILSSPDQFATLGPTINSLENWFPVAEIAGYRRMICDLIFQLGYDQRQSSISQDKNNNNQTETAISRDNDNKADEQNSRDSKDNQTEKQSSNQFSNIRICPENMSSQEYDYSSNQSLNSSQDKISNLETNQMTQKKLSKSRKFLCPICLLPMANFQCLRKHKCPITEVTTDTDTHLKVLGHESHTDMASILLSSNTPRQISVICEAGGFCVKGGYPYLFPRQNQKLPILSKIGVVGADAHQKLKLAVSEGPIKLKKILRIQIGSRVLELGPSLTIPHRLRSTGDIEIRDLGDSVEYRMKSSVWGPRTGDRRLIKGSVHSSSTHSSSSDHGPSHVEDNDLVTNAVDSNTTSGDNTKGAYHGGGGDGGGDSRGDGGVKSGGRDCINTCVPPPQQFRLLNKYRHPEYHTREEFRQRVKIFPEEFDQLCEDCKPATTSNSDLSHKVSSPCSVRVCECVCV